MPGSREEHWQGYWASYGCLPLGYLPPAEGDRRLLAQTAKEGAARHLF